MNEFQLKRKKKKLRLKVGSNLIHVLHFCILLFYYFISTIEVRKDQNCVYIYIQFYVGIYVESKRDRGKGKCEIYYKSDTFVYRHRSEIAVLNDVRRNDGAWQRLKVVNRESYRGSLEDMGCADRCIYYLYVHTFYAYRSAQKRYNKTRVTSYDVVYLK